MKTKVKASLLAFTLAACMACAACSPSAPAKEQNDEPEQGSEEVGASVERGGLSIAMGDYSGDGLLVESLAANIAANQALYAPVVETLADGTQVQRTPQDAGIYNVYTLNADNRGCSSCHSDLNAVLRNMPDTVFSGFSASPHQNLDFVADLEVGYDDCTGCHVGQYPTRGYWANLKNTIHGLHDTRNVEFVEQGGECMSCHVITADGGMGIWDMEKYTLLRGIGSADANEGTFDFDHDTLSEGRMFSMSWTSRDVESWPIVGEHINDFVYGGVEEDPAAFDSWEITIAGDVANPMTITLGELIEKIPSVTEKVAIECVENPRTGGIIRNVEITGIPLNAVLEMAGADPNAKYVSVDDVPNEYSFDMFVPADFLDVHDSWLIYEINGERLQYSEGYPLMVGAEGLQAGVWIKQAGLIQVFNEHDDPQSHLAVTFPGAVEPSQAILNTEEGQIIEVGKPYTFEGFANAFEGYGDAITSSITKIEFSLDMGQTWASFDIDDGVMGPWTYWSYTWTPEQPGAYVLQVRATHSGGLTSTTPAQVLVNAK